MTATPLTLQRIRGYCGLTTVAKKPAKPAPPSMNRPDL